MPWDVRKGKNGKWEIYKPNTGEVVGHSTSRKKAEASVRARYWGASKSGERLNEPISMAGLERMAVALVELGELAESGWEVQTIIFNKDAYSIREKALAKVKEMGFSSGSARETGDEDQGSWRVRQTSPDRYSEFRTQKINDNISLVHGKLK